jgi:AcrR family transcriptional regulator
MVPRRDDKLSRDDWLAAALEALEESGVGGVKVLPVAKRLGVSRGSFYWHFRDQRDLLDGVLDYWERWSTSRVIEALRNVEDVSAKERIWLLMSTVFTEELGARDPAIRAWALYDKGAARVVRRVDRRRLDLVHVLFREAGFSDQSAAMRSRLLAAYLLGEYVLFVREPPERRRRLLRQRWRLLVDG